MPLAVEPPDYLSAGGGKLLRSNMRRSSKSNPGYTASLSLKTKVLDFVKFGGPNRTRTSRG